MKRLRPLARQMPGQQGIQARVNALLGASDFAGIV